MPQAKTKKSAKQREFSSKTSWRTKLEKPQEPAVCPMPEKMAKRLGTGTLLIPTPLQVDAVVRTIPKGKLATTTQIRARLAKENGATTACPLCTGIFLRISAETSEEDAAAGRKEVTPYWRVVADDGSFNPKWPGGPESQARRLRAEGHKITKTPRGKLLVADLTEHFAGL